MCAVVGATRTDSLASWPPFKLDGVTLVARAAKTVEPLDSRLFMPSEEATGRPAAKEPLISLPLASQRLMVDFILPGFDLLPTARPNRRFLRQTCLSGRAKWLTFPCRQSSVESSLVDFLQRSLTEWSCGIQASEAA